jgi:hypothetical protein
MGYGQIVFEGAPAALGDAVQQSAELSNIIR